jgi:hypothetical protein
MMSEIRFGSVSSLMRSSDPAAMRASIVPSKVSGGKESRSSAWRFLFSTGISTVPS